MTLIRTYDNIGRKKKYKRERVICTTIFQIIIVRVRVWKSAEYLPHHIPRWISLLWHLLISSRFIRLIERNPNCQTLGLYFTYLLTYLLYQCTVKVLYCINLCLDKPVSTPATPTGRRRNNNVGGSGSRNSSPSRYI